MGFRVDLNTEKGKLETVGLLTHFWRKKYHKTTDEKGKLISKETIEEFI